MCFELESSIWCHFPHSHDSQIQESRGGNGRQYHSLLLLVTHEQNFSYPYDQYFTLVLSIERRNASIRKYNSNSTELEIKTPTKSLWTLPDSDL